MLVRFEVNACKDRKSGHVNPDEGNLSQICKLYGNVMRPAM